MKSSFLKLFRFFFNFFTFIIKLKKIKFKKKIFVCRQILFHSAFQLNELLAMFYPLCPQKQKNDRVKKTVIHLTRQFDFLGNVYFFQKATIRILIKPKIHIFFIWGTEKI